MNAAISAGIISAGHGRRLQASHPKLIKPMIPLRGEPLIFWTVSSLRQAGIHSMAILFNSGGAPARRYLESRFRDIEWTFLSQDTRSSWESFRAVSRTLAASSDRFLVSAVDALMRADDISRFVRASIDTFSSGAVPACEAALALTPFVEDERPLWAEMSPDGLVTALGDDVRRRTLVTCGLYAVTRKAADAMPDANAYGRLREYLIAAARRNRRLFWFPVPKTIDVDRPEDISAAEAFLKAAEIAA